MGKESTCNERDTGDAGSIPRSRRSPGEGQGNPHQYSCLKNPRDRGAWQATVHKVIESGTTEATGHAITARWPGSGVNSHLPLIMHHYQYHHLIIIIIKQSPFIEVSCALGAFKNRPHLILTTNISSRYYYPLSKGNWRLTRLRNLPTVLYLISSEVRIWNRHRCLQIWSNTEMLRWWIWWQNFSSGSESAPPRKFL